MREERIVTLEALEAAYQSGMLRRLVLGLTLGSALIWRG